MAKEGQNDKQRSTKHYRENEISRDANSTTNLGWTQVLEIYMYVPAPHETPVMLRLSDTNIIWYENCAGSQYIWRHSYIINKTSKQTKFKMNQTSFHGASKHVRTCNLTTAATRTQVRQIKKWERTQVLHIAILRVTPVTNSWVRHYNFRSDDFSLTTRKPCVSSLHVSSNPLCRKSWWEPQFLTYRKNELNPLSLICTQFSNISVFIIEVRFGDGRYQNIYA
jgi:hypothetical protein